MTSFVIHPNSSEAKVASIHVRKDLEFRHYPHYIRVHGKLQKNNAVVFSHLDITTDVVKADEGGYITPREWLDIFNNPIKHIGQQIAKKSIIGDTADEN